MFDSALHTRLIVAVLTVVALSACSSRRDVQSARTAIGGADIKIRAVQFVVFESGVRIAGYSADIGENSRSFYLILRDGRFDRLIDVPRYPSTERTVNGTAHVDSRRQDPAVWLQRIRTAPRVSPRSVNPAFIPDPRSEPMKILPAFVIAGIVGAPLIPVGLGSVAIENSLDSRAKNRLGTIAWSDNEASLTAKFGRPFRRCVRDSGEVDLHFGPVTPISERPDLVRRKLLIRLRHSAVWGAFREDFYIDPK